MPQSNFYEIVFKVDNYLITPSQDSFNEIQKLFSKEGIRRYFWRELIKNDKLDHDKWFNILLNSELFSLKTSKETEIINGRKYVKYWQELEYLEKISNVLLTNARIEKILSEIVNSLIEEYYDLVKEGYELHEHIYWITFKIISNNNVKYLESKHLEFIKFVLKRNDKTLISADLKSKFYDKVFETNNEKFINNFFELIFSFSYDKDEFYSLIEFYWLEELTKEKASMIPVEYQQLILETVLSKINDILNINDFLYDSFYIPSIEPSSQERYSSSGIPKICLDFVRDLLESMDSQIIAKNIENMIKDSRNIYKRLAIHLINCKYNDLKNIFWNIDYNPIDNSDLNHELFMLFKNHNNEFSESESEQIIQWNETQDFEYLKEYDNYDVYGKNWINKDKRKILYAFKNLQEDNILKKEFERYNNLLNFDEEYPEFNSYMSSSVYRRSNSPYSVDEILNMDIHELREKIISFKEEKGVKENPTVGGFASNIETAIEENYEKYIDKLDLLVDIPTSYHYKIFNGLNSKINSYKSNELDLFITYIKNILELKEDCNKYNELIFEYNEFIRNISSSEKVIKLNLGQVNTIISIFKSLRDKIQYYILTDEHKSDILNSNEGQYYSSIIIFSLKIARDKLYDENGIIWHRELKQIILEDLGSKKSFQLYEVIGRYLPNLYYLDKIWIKDKLKDLFIKSNDIYTTSLCKGYLSNPTVYLEIYTDIKNIGAFEYMLNTNFEKDKLNTRAIEFICIAFVADHDKNLIYEIVRKGETEQKKYILNYFKNKRNKNVDIEKHIIPLWKEFLTALEEKESELYIILFGWMNILKSINEDTNSLILQTIDKIDIFPQQYNYEVGRKIFNFIPENIKEIAIILIQLLRKYNIDFYQPDKLIESIEEIYKFGLIEEGNEISNLIGQKGNYALKELYIKYNS